MIRTEITGLGRLFLLLAGLFYLASMTSQSGLLLLLCGLLLATLLINLLVSRKTVTALELNIPVEVLLEEGEKLQQPWEITNYGKRPAQFVKITSEAGELLRLSEVPPEGKLSSLPSLHFTRRGIYDHSLVSLSSVAPFGLIQSTVQKNLNGRVVVYPKLYTTSTPPAAALDNILGGKSKGQRRTTSGSSFAGVRTWVDGDPFKHIHWKSTAAHQKLMVKLFDEELSGKVTIILDASAHPTHLEEAIRAAGSLACAASAEGHLVQFLTTSAFEPLLLQPFGDPHDLLITLAGLKPVNKVPLLSLLISPRSYICLVSPGISPDLLHFTEALSAAGRKIALFLPEGTLIPEHTAVPVHTFGQDNLKLASFAA